MDISTLANIGKVEKEFKVGENLKVKMHTLSSEEQTIIIGKTSDKTLDAYARKNALDLETLVASITEINGTEVTETTTRDFVNKMQATLQVKLLACYGAMEQESKTQVELSKNA